MCNDKDIYKKRANKIDLNKEKYSLFRHKPELSLSHMSFYDEGILFIKTNCGSHVSTMSKKELYEFEFHKNNTNDPMTKDLISLFERYFGRNESTWFEDYVATRIDLGDAFVVHISDVFRQNTYTIVYDKNTKNITLFDFYNKRSNEYEVINLMKFLELFINLKKLDKKRG